MGKFASRNDPEWLFIAMEANLEAFIGVIIAAVIGVLIGKDATSRGMNGLGWGIFTFLICIIAIPIYLIVRKDRISGA